MARFCTSDLHFQEFSFSMSQAKSKNLRGIQSHVECLYKNNLKMILNAVKYFF